MWLTHFPAKRKIPRFSLGGDTNAFGVVSGSASSTSRSNVRSYLLWWPFANKGASESNFKTGLYMNDILETKAKVYKKQKQPKKLHLDFFKLTIWKIFGLNWRKAENVPACERVKWSVHSSKTHRALPRRLLLLSTIACLLYLWHFTELTFSVARCTATHRFSFSAWLHNAVTQHYSTHELVTCFIFTVSQKSCEIFLSLMHRKHNICNWYKQQRH